MLPPHQGKSVRASQLMVENLIMANGKPEVASTQCILKLYCLGNICIHCELYFKNQLFLLIVLVLHVSVRLCVCFNGTIFH